MIDVQGQRYLDGVSSLWCNVHGHRHPAAWTRPCAQLEKVAHSTLLGISHVPPSELARRLVERAPGGLSRVFFSDDGATAVEVALKMAFQYFRQKDSPEPNRTRFLAAGEPITAIRSATSASAAWVTVPCNVQAAPFSTIRATMPHCYRCPLGLEPASCALACLGEVERLLAAHEGEVAAPSSSSPWFKALPG